MMRGKSVAVLAVRAWGTEGRERSDTTAVEQLKDAAAAIAAADPQALAGPSESTPDGALLLPLASPSGTLNVILTIADLVRPLRTTFAVVLTQEPVTRNAPTHGGAAARGTDARPPHDEGADFICLTLAEASASALSALEATDPRDARVLVRRPRDDSVLASLIDLVLLAYDSMTERQKQIIALVEESDTQQQVAAHLNISRQAVNQSLAAAHWSHLRRASAAIAARLNEESFIIE
jgi:DNA-binding NarL/FixJ family response regulator